MAGTRKRLSIQMSTLAEAFARLLAVLDRMKSVRSRRLCCELGGDYSRRRYRGRSETRPDRQLRGGTETRVLCRRRAHSRGLRDGAVGKCKSNRQRLEIRSFPSAQRRLQPYGVRPAHHARNSARRKGREAKRSEAIECSLASVEDTVLRKLERYRAGVEASERQWNDLRGVVHAAAGQIDADYLRRWAVYLQVEDLLSKLLAEDR